MNKRLISILIIAVMVISVLPVSAFAFNIEGTCGSSGANLRWVYNSNTRELIISGSGSMANYSYTEGTFAPWRTYKDNIDTVIISGGVTSIGEYAFYEFSKLTSISIPDSVTYIGKDAFKLCVALTTFTAPKNITEITRHLFHDCAALTKVVLHKNITLIHTNAFENCPNLNFIDYEGSDRDFQKIEFELSSKKDLMDYNPTVQIKFKGGHTHEFGEFISNGMGTCYTPATESATCKFKYCNYVETRVDEDAPSPHWVEYYIYNDDEDYDKNGTETGACMFGCGTEVTREKANTKLVNSTKIFKDIQTGKWYTQYIDSAVGRGLFNGVSDTTFEPNTPMNRAMFVTVLYRMSGQTYPDNVAVIFNDIPNGKYYSTAVKWASKASIVTGVTKTKFEPDTAITREQLCTMLIRYSDYMAIALDSNTKATTFKDDKKISKYAYNSVYLCQRGGLINGVGNGNFEPQKTATRAEVAKILSLYYKYNLYLTYQPFEQQ